jgi:endonuclease G, mitochondrial
MSMHRFKRLVLASLSALAMALAAVAGSAFAAGSPACSGQGGKHVLPYASEVPEGYEHDRFDTQPKDRVFSYGPFTSSFEASGVAAEAPRAAVPRWVAYEMHAFLGPDGRPAHPEAATRPHSWYELDSLDFLWTGRPDVRRRGVDPSYVGFAETWNRGHMAARSHANRLGWQQGCNSHVFVNAVPQYSVMNQGDWLALENYAAALANKYARAWTIAGPIFDPSLPIRTIGDPGTVPVAIPHALFKILAVEVEGRIEARGFIFPQADEAQRNGYRRCAGTRQADFDLKAYGATIAAIESRTGLHFFRKLTEPERRALDAHAADGPWTVESRHFERSCGARGGGE